MVRVFPKTLKFVEKAVESDDSLFEQRPNRVLEELFLVPLLKVFSEEKQPWRKKLRRLLRLGPSK